jgi:hypothetical protein
LHWYVGIINWRILNGVGRPLLWDSILLVKAGEDEEGFLVYIGKGVVDA